MVRNFRAVDATEPRRDSNRSAAYFMADDSVIHLQRVEGFEGPTSANPPEERKMCLAWPYFLPCRTYTQLTQDTDGFSEARHTVEPEGGCQAPRGQWANVNVGL